MPVLCYQSTQPPPPPTYPQTNQPTTHLRLPNAAGSIFRWRGRRRTGRQASPTWGLQCSPFSATTSCSGWPTRCLGQASLICNCVPSLHRFAAADHQHLPAGSLGRQAHAQEAWACKRLHQRRPYSTSAVQGGRRWRHAAAPAAHVAGAGGFLPILRNAGACAMLRCSLRGLQHAAAQRSNSGWPAPNLPSIRPSLDPFNPLSLLCPPSCLTLLFPPPTPAGQHG